MADLSKLLVKVIIDQSGFNSDINDITAADSASTKAFGAWGVTVGNLASKAITKSIRAAMDFLSSTISTGMNFDKEMSAVKAVAQMTESEFEAVRQKALDLGGSTVFTSEEVGEAFYYMGVAGWNAEEMLDGIAGVLDLAAASGANLGTVSDIVTDAITAMGLSAKDTQHFVDVLAAASANSNTTVEKMGESFKYFANVAGIYNYSIDDVATALGLLANTGVKASQAGTSLRRVMINFTKPSEDAEAAMKALGISLYDDNDAIKPFMQVMQELRQIMVDSGFDPAGRDMKAYADRISQLEEQLEAGTIKQEDFNLAFDEATAMMTNSGFLEALTSIGGARGLPALLAIMRSSDKDFNQLVSSIANSEGAAGTMAGTMLDNLAGDITLFNSALDNLKIEVFDKFNETIRSFVQEMTGFVNFLSGGTKTVSDNFEDIGDSEENTLARLTDDQNVVNALIKHLEDLESSTGDSEEKLAEWKKTAETLVGYVPTLGDQLDFVNGKFKTQAEDVKAAADEFYANARAQAVTAANQSRLDALAKQQTLITEKQVDLIAAKGKYQYDARTAQIAELYQSALASANVSAATKSELGGLGLAEDISTWGAGDYLSALQAMVGLRMRGAFKGERSIAEGVYGLENANAISGLTEIQQLEANISGLTSELAQYEQEYVQYTEAAETYLKTLQENLNALPTEINIPVNVGEAVDGSHATGLSYVPYDGYIAKLHRGEQVVTASNARKGSTDTDAIITAVTAAINQSMKSLMGSLKIVLNNKTVGTVVGDSVTTRVNNNIGSMQERISRGYGG